VGTALPDGEAVRLNVPPAHTGLLLSAVIPSVFIVTVVVALAVQPDALLLTVTV
jgi:hypothetical protein